MIPKSTFRRQIDCSNCAKTKTQCDWKSPCSRCAKCNLKCTIRPSRQTAKPNPLARNAEAFGPLKTFPLPECSDVANKDCMSSSNRRSNSSQPGEESFIIQPPNRVYLASDTTPNHQEPFLVNSLDETMKSESVSMSEKISKPDIVESLSRPCSPKFWDRPHPLSASACGDWDRLSSITDEEIDCGSTVSDSTDLNYTLETHASNSKENLFHSNQNLRLFTLDILQRITSALGGIRSRNDTSDVNRSSGQKTTDHPSSSNNSSSPNSGSARKRGRDKLKSDEFNDGHDDEWRKGNRKRSPDGPMPKRPQKLTLRFACPFNKRDPERHCKWRSCIGPGWESVHRAK